jgi:protein SCO1/2
LADLGRAEQLLGDKAERVQMIFVTVDPERDTPQRMRDYLAFFGQNFVGLSGSLEETETIAGQFGVIYEKQIVSQSATDYLIDHSSVVVVLDPERRPLVMFPYGVTAEQIAADIQAVVR